MQSNFTWFIGNFKLSLLGVVMLLITTSPLFSQNTISVRVEEGQATSTCTDGFDGEAEPLWQVNVNGEGYITYSECEESLPNTQFESLLDCIEIGALGGEIQVCLKVFENDPRLFDPCHIDAECEEEYCEFFVIPLAGESTSYELKIPENLESGGRVSFTITNEGDQEGASNDHICHAIDLGVLQPNSTLGDRDIGRYNNFCATATKEINPFDLFPNKSFTNNVGVWFQFNTGDEPSDLLLVEALSDPEQVGDPVSLQLALFESEDGTCKGDLVYVTEHHDSKNYDEYMLLECLPPNQDFYILVDAVYDENSSPDFPLLNGYFSLAIEPISVLGNNDKICEAQTLEVLDGITNTYSDFYNNCATNTDDPIITNFPSLHPVWFNFQPPTSRRVRIEVIGDMPYPEGIDPIIPQIAVFEATNEDCTEELNRLAYHYDSDSRINTIGELGCLDPNKTYWLMIDGNEEQPTGIFDIAITDLGFPEKQTQLERICAGSTFELGNKTYSQPGTTLDTIIYESGCLEIVEITIELADSLFVEVDFPKLASQEEVEDGIAELTISGGSGNYLVTWPDGDNAFRKEELAGGIEYCVTVTDIVGCTLKRCFEMPYVQPMRASLKSDTLNCFGDANGVLELQISEGAPPYQYTLHNSNKQIILEGIVESRTDTLQFQNLIADDYTVILSATGVLNTIRGKVIEPSPVEATIFNQQEVSCFGTCDGALSLITSGGNGEYTLFANNNFEEEFTGTNLCAGNYSIITVDKKGCQGVLEVDIPEPVAFIAKAIEITPVKCFGEENGAASISTSGTPIAYEWDNGVAEIRATNLAAGIHTVVVTNEDNCTDTAFVEIREPAPINTTLEIISEINCFDDKNGMLQSRTEGGNGNFELSWSNGIKEAINDNLGAGEYSLTVTDQLGCTTTTTTALEQPDELTTSIATQNVTCPGGSQSGRIAIETTTGGTAPYAYQLSDNTFTEDTDFPQLEADDYQITIQDANGCEKVETVTISPPPVLNLDLEEEQNIKLGKTIQLEAITNRPVRYEWEVPDSINCGDCPSIEFQPFSSFNYAVTVTDLESECTATEEARIIVSKERELYVPNVFSPNGDGNNDFLMVFGGNDIEIIEEFKVFSRQGSLVYEANNFSPNDAAISWRGEYNGQKLAPGVFVYYAKVRFIDKFEDVFSGDFALMR